MARREELDNAFSKYAERMMQVSRLSSPSLDDVEDADDYSLLLHHNFMRIGELASENCEVMDRLLLPILNKEEALSEEEIDSLEKLNSLLINMNVEDARDLDIHLAELTTERIEREHEKLASDHDALEAVAERAGQAGGVEGGWPHEEAEETEKRKEAGEAEKRKEAGETEQGKEAGKTGRREETEGAGRERATGSDALSADDRIRLLDKRIDIVVNQMYSYLRAGNMEEAERLQKQGLKDYQEILEFLDKDVYLTLSIEAKDMVLTNAYFGAILYDYMDEKKMIECLKNARVILEDSFYRKATPGYEWRKSIFRTYEYIAEMSYHEEYKYEDTYLEAYKSACILERIWPSDPEYYGVIMKWDSVKSLALYGAVRSGDASLGERLTEMEQLYRKRDVSDYGYSGMISNLDNAIMLYETIGIAREKRGAEVSESLIRLQQQIPRDFVSYLYRSNNTQIMSWLLTALVNFVYVFREVPGGIKGEELFLQIIVALHPPTYIHSVMVARLSMCLARHLLEAKPELFADFPGCEKTESIADFPGCEKPRELVEKKNEILDYIYHAAMVHDIGKVRILDTIAMYGRRLLDSEFRLLKLHPDYGAEIAEALPSLQPYVDVIRGHHVWYDGSHGYPEDFEKGKSPYKTIIDIVMAADCLDAATDGVGRSYRKGKSLEDFQKELQDGAGTRYAPWLPELFADPATNADIRYMLDEGRKALYRETFHMLKEITHK